MNTGTERAGVKVFNYIRNNSTENFLKVVPSATSDNIATLKGILFDNNYAPLLNEFVGTLINRIAFTIIENKQFTNPLAIFKKGSIPLGTDIQEIFTNPAVAEQYEYSNTAMAKLLTITDPDTKAAYYRRNRQDLYTKTISREGLQGAFTSWENFEQFIASITTSLYSGNYIDEFKYTKELINGAYNEGKAIVQTVTAPTNATTGKAFLKQVRTLYNLMKFPSSDYNAYSKFNPDKTPVVTWTEDDRVVLVIRADVLAEIDVDVLASAFNIDKADFIGRVVPVDKFDNPNILGVICDESWFKIYDNIFRFDEFYNARVMAWNEYLHAWGTFAISPFANAVILATEEVTPITAIDINGGQAIELDIASTPSNERLEITFTPTTGDSYVEYTTNNPLIFSVERISNNEINLIPYTTGSGILTAKSGNIEATATVNVVNSNKTE